MNQGQPFFEEQKSPNERLLVLEQKIPVLIQKIQSYDKVLEDFKELNLKLDSLNNGFNKSASNIENLEQKVESNLSFSKQNNREFLDHKASSIENNKNNLNQLDFLKSSLENMSSYFSKIFNDNKSDVLKLQNSSASKSELLDHENKNHEKLNDLKNNLSNLQSSVSEISKDHPLLKASSQDASSNLMYLHSALKDLQDKNKTDYSLKDLRSELSNLVKNTSDSLNSNFDQKLNEVKALVDNSPDMLDKVKRDILQKLDAVSLDGSNASIKASNCSQQILMIEKKIENIYLLLKKFELNK